MLLTKHLTLVKKTHVRTLLSPDCQALYSSRIPIFYRGETHRLALTTLEYGILNHAGFGCSPESPGWGRPHLFSKILAEHRNHFTTGLITNTYA